MYELQRHLVKHVVLSKLQSAVVFLDIHACIICQHVLWLCNDMFHSRHRCEKLMQNRLELYREAVEVVPIHDLRDLYAHLYNSPNRGYIALVILGIIGAIFTVGILFGRVSKRQRREMKLK